MEELALTDADWDEALGRLEAAGTLGLPGKHEDFLAIGGMFSSDLRRHVLVMEDPGGLNRIEVKCECEANGI